MKGFKNTAFLALALLMLVCTAGCQKNESSQTAGSGGGALVV
jgi:uncharacterized lipoprotein YehR (DUF1307 family)